MANGYVLYNPLAGDGNAEEDATLLQMLLDETLLYYDITRITNYAAFIGGMAQEDYLVIAGGDGTLNRFVNDTDGLEISHEILYLSAGTGNDFSKDLGKNLYLVTKDLKALPSVEVNGKRYRFLNGIDFGLDGDCCRAGDALRKIPGKKVCYPGIAMQGLLFRFSPRNATVTVDGKKYTYQKVWLAPTMYGRYCCGGMIPAPRQDRNSGTLSVMLMHGGGRLRTLFVFSGIFKGSHVKHKNMVAVHTGKEITVEFDQPAPLQIDGEIILGVTKYTAKAAVCGASLC